MALDPLQPAGLDPYGLRPRGLGTGSGELLAAARGPQQPYVTPAWARKLTYSPLPTVPAEQQQPSGFGGPGFPTRIELPNIFGSATPTPGPQGGLVGELLAGAPGVALGVTPGEQRGGAYMGIATTPMTVANFASYGREGLFALLSSVFLDGAYQQGVPATFGTDTEYAGPSDLSLPQGALKGTIEANKTIGDWVWGVTDGVVGSLREEDARGRARQVALLFQAGSADRPVLPSGDLAQNAQWINNVVASIFGGSEKFSLKELQESAWREGVDLTSHISGYWDIAPEIVAAIERDPYMSEEQLAQLVAGEPFSYDPLANMAAELGAQAALLGAGYVGVVRAAGLLSRLGSVGGAVGRVASGAGWVTRKAAQINALNTGAGWTTRGLEWGVKQYGVIVGDEGLVTAMDRLQWEMPWSMNPGLNLIDGFTLIPRRSVAQLRGAVADVREAVTTRAFARPQALDGRLDVDALTASRAAVDDVDVLVAGTEVRLPASHPVAKAVETIGALTLDDIHANLMRGTGWQRGWLEMAFGEGNKYGLTVDDLRDFLVYGYGQVVRDRGFAPMTLEGATNREKSLAFFRTEAPEIVDSLFSDLHGRSHHLSDSIRGQWWELSALNDSRMAQVKSRLGEAYSPLVAFSSMLHWIGASKRLDEAYKAGLPGVGEFVPTFSRRIQMNRLLAFRDHVTSRYRQGERISRDDILEFRRSVGPVELYEPGLQTARRKFTREQFLKLIDRIAESEDAARPTVRRTDPGIPADWAPGQSFAADARVLGIPPEDVLLIEAAMREPPAAMPPRPLLAKVASETGRSADALAADAKGAWEAVIDWYQTALDDMVGPTETRRSLVAMGEAFRARVAEGRMEAGLGARAADAIDRIAAEVVDRPRVRLPGRAREEGVLYADADGLVRWQSALARAEEVAGRAKGHLEAPERAARVIERETQVFPALAGTEGLVDALAVLSDFATTHPGTVLFANGTDEAAALALAGHPLLRADALRAADWTAAPAAIRELAATTLTETLDGQRLARELATEVMGEPLDEGAALAPILDDVTQRAIAYRAAGESLADEILAVERAFDTIYGNLAAETRVLADRMAAGGVERTRPLVSPELRARETTVGQRRSAANVTAQVVAVAEAQLANLDQLISEAPSATGPLEWLPAANLAGTPYKALRTKTLARNVAAELAPITGLAYRVERVGRRWQLLQGRRAQAVEEPASAAGLTVEAPPPDLTGPEGVIEQAMARGDVAESQAANIEVGLERGGTPESGGAMLPEPPPAVDEAALRAVEERRGLVEAETGVQYAHPESALAQMRADLAAKGKGKHPMADFYAGNNAQNLLDQYAAWQAAIESITPAKRPALEAAVRQVVEKHGRTVSNTPEWWVDALKEVGFKANKTTAGQARALAQEMEPTHVRHFTPTANDLAGLALFAERTGIELPPPLRIPEQPDIPSPRSLMSEPERRASDIADLEASLKAKRGVKKPSAMIARMIESEEARLAELRAQEAPAAVVGKETTFPDPLDETARVNGRFALMDIEQLVTSDRPGYRAELQPRDRAGRVASEAQVQGISRTFDPELALRVESGSDGPALVAADGQVLAGNGRTRAMRDMDETRWSAYHAALIRRAAEFGIEPADIGPRSVLVRQVGDEVMTPRYAAAFNARTGGMSSAEMAISVSRMVTPEDITAMGDIGEKVALREALKQPSRSTFNQRILGELTPEQQRAFMDAGGGLSDDGVRLVMNAMLAKVVPDVGLVTRLIEAPEDAARYRAGLEMAMAQVVRAEAAATTEVRIGPTLALALRRILDLTDQGVKRDRWPAEFSGVGMFEDVTGENALASILADMNSQQEVATLLRGYARALEDSSTVGMFEDRTTLASLVNAGVDAVQAGRATGGFFGAQDVPRFPEADGTIRTMYETPGGGIGQATEVPVIESSRAAVEARIGQPATALIHDLAELDGVPEGTAVVYRARHETEARWLRSLAEEPAIAETVREWKRAVRESDDPVASYDALVRELNEGTSTSPGIDYAAARAMSDFERFDEAGHWNAPYSASAAATDDIGAVAQRVARIEGTLGPDEAAALAPDDIAIAGGGARRVPADFEEQAGFRPDMEPDIERARAARDSGTQTFVRPDDEVAQRAAQTVAGLPRGARPALTILNDVDQAVYLNRLQSQRDALAGRLESQRAILEERRAAAAETGPSSPELEFPPDLLPLWDAYMGDQLSSAGFGTPPPRTVANVYDALRSLDYDFPPPRPMAQVDREALREGLRAFLDDKMDEWGVPDQPGGRPPRRVASTLSHEGASGTSPTEHSAVLEDLAASLGDRIFVADEPLEGYLGVGYEFTVPPVRGVDGAPLGPRLYWTANLTDELARADAAVPGLGMELAQPRMRDWPGRVQDVNDHNMGQRLASNSVLSALRSIVDTGFGPRPQRTIEAETFARLTDDLLDVKPEEAARILNDPVTLATYEEGASVVRGMIGYLHEQMALETFGPTPFRLHRRIGLLKPAMIEKWGRDYLSTRGDAGLAILSMLDERARGGDRGPLWASFRKADNRIRAYFAQRPGGVADFVESIYEGPVRRASVAMSGLTVAYHAYRFLMDARWLAMEFVEMPILLASREGPGALVAAVELQRGKRAPNLLFAEQGAAHELFRRWAWWSAQSDPGGYMRFRENGILAMVERSQQKGLVSELERMAKSDERLAALIKANDDTPLRYLQKLDRDWRTMATRGRQFEEREMRDLLGPYLEEGTIGPAEFDEMVAAGRWVGHPGIEDAIRHADDPVTRLMLRRFQVITEQAWGDASALIFGQVDRSNVQRLMNHPLLYWPISYQIKATKWLAGIMFDRFLGADTGAGVAVSMGIIWEQHKQALADDPEYQEWLRANDTLIFMAQMLIPVTPFDIGISMSPFTRLGYSMLTGHDIASEEPYRRNIFSVGTGYSVLELYPRLFSEQAAQEGLVGDLAERAGYAFPQTIRVRPSSGSRLSEAERRAVARLGALAPITSEQPATRYGP